MLSLSTYRVDDSYPYNSISIDENVIKRYIATLNLNRDITRECRRYPAFSVLVSMGSTSSNYVKKIRNALRENSGVTKYIVTITRKGVSFEGTCVTRKGALESARSRLRAHRLEQRTPYKATRTFWVGGSEGHVRFNLIGLCHESPGAILKLQATKKSLEVFKNKSPKTNDKYLSYELEFFTPSEYTRNDIAADLMEAGVSEYVTLKGDGSVRSRRGDDHTHELVVCVPRPMLEQVTDKVTRVLAKNLADVNDSCGFHVHLDMRDKSRSQVEHIFSNLVSAQSVLFKMLPPSRKNGRTSGGTHYCAPNRTKQFDKNLSTRYKAINACAYSKYRTLEVRLHSGTVNYEKIIRFIEILERIADTPDTIVRSATTVSGFAKQFNLPAQLTQYIEARVAKFNAAHSSDTRGSTTELEQ